MLPFNLANLPRTLQIEIPVVKFASHIQIEETVVLMIIMTPMNNRLTNKGKGIFQSSWNFIETNRTIKTWYKNFPGPGMSYVKS